MTTFKFAGFQVHQVIRAQDFESHGARCYIEGVVLHVLPDGSHDRRYPHYVIRVTRDVWNGLSAAGRSRVGCIGYVPMETTMDWDGRVAPVHHIACECKPCSAWHAAGWRK